MRLALVLLLFTGCAEVTVHDPDAGLSPDGDIFPTFDATTVLPPAPVTPPDQPNIAMPVILAPDPPIGVHEESDLFWSDCPLGQYAENIPMGDILYARPGELSMALGVAQAGSVIALAKGTFSEGANVPAGITLWGACPSETIIASSTIAGILRNVTVEGGLRVSGTTEMWSVIIRGGGDRMFEVVEQGTFLSGHDIILTDSAGLRVHSGAYADIERAVFERNRDVAVEVVDFGSSLSLRDFIIRGTRARPSDLRGGRGVVVNTTANGGLERGIIEDNLDFGVVANSPGASINLYNVLIRRTQPNTVDHLRGIGLSAQGGASLYVSRAALEENAAGIAISSVGAGSDIADVRIASSTGLPGGELGYGIVVLGGTAMLRNVELVNNRFHSMLVAGSSTAVSAQDLHIARTQPQSSDQMYGRGIGVEDKARLDLHRAVIEDNFEVGISAIGGSFVFGEDLVISRTRARQSDQKVGYGVLAQESASITLVRAIVEDATKVGVAGLAPSMVSLTDTTVRDTDSDANGDFGLGLISAGFSSVVLSRVALERNRHSAMRIESGSVLMATDLRISETLGRASDDAFGTGLIVLDGSFAGLTRAEVLGNRIYGIGVYRGGSNLDANDLVIDGTRPDASALYGIGVLVQDNCSGRIERATIRNNSQVGVLVQQASVLSMRDVEVSYTQRASCGGEPRCEEQAGGVGVGSYASASVTMERFLLSHNAIAGAAIAREGSLDLSRGEISDHLIGVNVESDSYDYSRLLDAVIFRDNERNIDSSTIPLPEAVNEIPSPIE